jgi:ubiquitin
MRILIAATRFATPLAMTALCTIPAAAQFEGSVTWAVGKKQTPMTQTYKGSMVRTDMTGPRGGSGAMIIDGAAKTMTMVMPEQKMFMKWDLEKMGEQMRNEHTHKNPKITDTGKSENIAGRSCQVYRYAEDTDKPETMEMCVAKGMGNFMMGRSPMGMGRGQGDGDDVSEIASNPEFQKLYKDGFFPLRISKIKGDVVTTQMIATKLEPGSVDASLFQVPSDYQEMKMPAGMGMPRQ